MRTLEGANIDRWHCVVGHV